jgi:hypothetical protein
MLRVQVKESVRRLLGPDPNLKGFVGYGKIELTDMYKNQSSSKNEGIGAVSDRGLGWRNGQWWIIPVVTGECWGFVGLSMPFSGSS